MIIALWIFFAIVIGVWADTKMTRLNGIVVFFLSLVLSPIVGLIIVIASKPDEDRLLNSKKFKKCPKCAELVKVEAIKCKFCGYEFSSQAPT